jgi:hypothetical protein
MQHLHALIEKNVTDGEFLKKTLSTRPASFAVGTGTVDLYDIGPHPFPPPLTISVFSPSVFYAFGKHPSLGLIRISKFKQLWIGEKYLTKNI